MLARSAAFAALNVVMRTTHFFDQKAAEVAPRFQFARLDSIAFVILLPSATAHHDNDTASRRS